MKIVEILDTILQEEIQNKKLGKFLFDRWSNENPGVDENEVEAVYNRFQEIKNKLAPELPQVISFLSRFDGKFGYSLFDPENLKDISKYSYKEIKSLIEEYTPYDEVEEEENEEVFFNDDASEEEKIMRSKDLWFGDRYCIINEGNFRVYDIPNHNVSSKFGFYPESLTHRRWCVTFEKSSSYWQSYRKNRSFYFIIDEEKGRDNSYFISTLQVDKSVPTGFRITSMKNDGDNPFYWDRQASPSSTTTVTSIYPKLERYKNLFNEKPFSEEELKSKSLASLVSETPGSAFEFIRLDRKKKKAYVSNHGVLTKPESWRSMDADLRNTYIRFTENFEYLAKFGNNEFVTEIKKVGVEFRTLDSTLKFIGVKKGTLALFEHFIEFEFDIARRSKNNNNIAVLVSKNTGKYGIHNFTTMDWVTQNGVTYNSKYKILRTTSIKDDKNTPYMVEIFSNSSTIDNNTFYALSPFTDRLRKAYILSADGYNTLEEKMTTNQSQNKNVKQLQNFEPETDVDIKEIKGV